MGFSSLVTFGSIFLNSGAAVALGVSAIVTSISSIGAGGGVMLRAAGFGVSSVMVCSLIADSVMSVNGVDCRCMGSGDTVVCGVGSGGGDSGESAAIETRETLLFRAIRASFTLRRFGASRLVGDEGSPATLSGGLKICDGSTDSLTRVRLVGAALLRGVVASVAIVFLLGDDRVFLAGAGVKSSSSSSSC